MSFAAPEAAGTSVRQRLFGTSEPARIRADATLSPHAADRTYRLARVVDGAIDLIGDRDQALAWMSTPNACLGGETPVRMLDTEVGADAVTESLSVIVYGGLS